MVVFDSLDTTSYSIKQVLILFCAYLEGFLRRGCRQNLYSTDKPSIAQIVEEADENLFNSIRYNPSHLLHQLLPRRTESSYSLRSRPHNFELSHIHDDRNLIDRMLFYPYHNA